MKENKQNEARKESARAGQHGGSGARGRRGTPMENADKRRLSRVGTGTASTERDHGRSKTERQGREHRQGTS